MKNVVVDWAETCTHPALLLYRFADGTKEEKKGEQSSTGNRAVEA